VACVRRGVANDELRDELLAKRGGESVGRCALAFMMAFMMRLPSWSGPLTVLPWPWPLELPPELLPPLPLLLPPPLRLREGKRMLRTRRSAAAIAAPSIHTSSCSQCESAYASGEASYSQCESAYASGEAS
jgi:hypothetical protein